MKPRITLLVLSALVQGVVDPDSTSSHVTRSCIATEQMPILGLRTRAPEPMPVARTDSAWRSRMPVRKLVPCYLVDSLDLRRGPIAEDHWR